MVATEAVGPQNLKDLPGKFADHILSSKSLDLGDCQGDGEKWTDSRYI